MTTYYKFTRTGRRPTHANNGFVWPAPSGKRPGKWTDRIDNIAACERGYHLTTVPHLLTWASDELWIADGRGASVDAGDKVVFESARLVRRVDAWNERTAREFACWCADQVLHLIPEPYRATCANTIEVARAFADGRATPQELAAARAAARAAAWDAAWDAAGDAAWDAAGAAARDAARDAQTAHLVQLLGLEESS